MRLKISRLFVVAVAVVAVSSSASAAFAYGPGQTGSLSSSTSTCDPTSGCTLSLTGIGFQPGETINFTLYSTPVALGSTTADPTGSFTVSETVPAGTPVGSHTIVAVGATSGTTATFAFTVAAASASSVTPAPSGSGGLAFTGADVTALAGVGAIALALGGLLILTSRRRRTRHVPVS